MSFITISSNVTCSRHGIAKKIYAYLALINNHSLYALKVLSLKYSSGVITNLALHFVYCLNLKCLFVIIYYCREGLLINNENVNWFQWWKMLWKGVIWRIWIVIMIFTWVVLLVFYICIKARFILKSIAEQHGHIICMFQILLHYLVFQSIDTEFTWWRLFQKRAFWTKCDI